jgi:pimeloyl-ACP methyl ester carboxylesterase
MKLLKTTVALALFFAASVPAQDEAVTETISAEETSADQQAIDLFARDSYRIDTIVCPFKDDIDYEPGTIECGLLEVPENRENPGSRMIELHFVKLNSRWGREDYDENRDEDADKHAEGLADGKRDDPVVYLTGGPGAQATYYVKRFKDHTLLDHRDLYILEQRGIGFSDDFCAFDSTRKPEVGDVATFAENLKTGAIRVADCARNASAAGVDLTGYNTIENARDVKALRRALGFEQWNVWGISYGSILGQAYIKEDPEGILAVALDAIMPLDIAASDEYWRVVHWYERDLQKLQEICQRQPDCAKNYPDIPGRLREAVRSVVDNPIEVDVKDTELYPSGKARAFQDIVAMLPFIFLYEQSNYPAVPGLIYAWADVVERRDEAMFKTLASPGDSGFGDGSDGMRNAILCIDGDTAALERAGKLDIAAYPVLGTAMNSEESLARATALCSELGMFTRPVADYKPTQTAIPTLIIEGDMDPITPPPNAKAILPGFENGTYVEFPYAGHGPSRSVKCAGHMLNKFYDNPGAEPDLSCTSDMEEPQFWAPMFTTSIATKLVAMAADDKKKLAIPGVWAGLSIIISLIAFLLLTFSPIFRWMDRRRVAEAGFARGFAWLAATSSVVSTAIIGAAFAATAEASELLLIFGLVTWARYGAYLSLFAIAAGIAALFTTIGARREFKLPISSMLGFMLTGLAAVGLGAFMMVWGLSPF